MFFLNVPCLIILLAIFASSSLAQSVALMKAKSSRFLSHSTEFDLVVGSDLITMDERALANSLWNRGLDPSDLIFVLQSDWVWQRWDEKCLLGSSKEQNASLSGCLCWLCPEVDELHRRGLGLQCRWSASSFRCLYCSALCFRYTDVQVEFWSNSCSSMIFSSSGSLPQNL